MTLSRSDALLALRGAQEPSFCCAPASSATPDMDLLDEFAESIDIRMDAWQRGVFERGMGILEDGRWAARHVGVCVPRQNGKTMLLALRALYGAIVLGERIVVHTAQRLGIAREQQVFIDGLVRMTPELARWWVRTDMGGGRECIEFSNGSRILFRARAGQGGKTLRGLSIDCLIFDEAAFLGPEDMEGARYALSARPYAQIVYAGTAPDAVTMPDSVEWARLRAAAYAGTGERLAWSEWVALDVEGPAAITSKDMVADPAVWARANPALGTRILADDVRDELEMGTLRSFCIERLGIGDWPPTVEGGGAVIPLADWDACLDLHSQLVGQPFVAFDVDPDRGRGAVYVAGDRGDGLLHVELVEYFRSGIDGLVPYIARFYQDHQPAAVVCDGASPAASLADELAPLGVDVQKTTAGEMARACGLLYDTVLQRGLRHLGDDPTRDALRSAAKRVLVDAWAFSRKNSTADISPVVALALARWVAGTAPQPLPPELMFPGFERQGGERPRRGGWDDMPNRYM